MLSPALQDRENSKFAETEDGHTAVVVVPGSAVFAPPPETDSITAAYPNDTTEVYSYRVGGISGTIIMTLTVIYVDNTKALIQSVART